MNIINQSVSILINSKEQIFVEKLKSLLKIGIRSTRYKDIFDLYYLINNEKIDDNNLIKYLDILIFKDKSLYEKNIDDIINRLTNIFQNKRYQNMLNMANDNWLSIPLNKVIDSILKYINNLKKIKTHS